MSTWVPPDDMIHDSAFIDQIVSSVLEQIQRPAGGSVKDQFVAESVPPSVSQPGKIHTAPSENALRSEAVPVPEKSIAQAIVEPVPSKTVGLTQSVVTAATLEGLMLSAGATVLLAPKTILTPSANDWLRERKIAWSRSSGAVKASPGKAGGGHWQLLASTVTPTVRSLLEQMNRSYRDWRQQLVGGLAETAESAVRLIATAEADRVLVVINSAEALACIANRNGRVRAAVVQSADHLRTVEEEFSPNVVVINPAIRSLMELRHLVQVCADLPAPRLPSWSAFDGASATGKGKA